MEHAELLDLETSVLRTLCLTANSESSTHKSRIVVELSEGDFYFPITKSIFSTIFEMTHSGTNVDVTSLQRALARRSVSDPDDFFVEDLFAGEAPLMETLTEWIGHLKGDELSLPSAAEESPAPSPRLTETHPTVTVRAPEPPPVEEPTPETAPESPMRPQLPEEDVVLPERGAPPLRQAS